MQSQYGVPEIQQFMVEGGYTPFFSIPIADTHSSSQPQKQHLHAHQLQQQQHHHLQQQHPQQLHPHHHYQQVQRQHHHGQNLHLHHHHPQLQLQPQVPPPQLQAFQHFQPIPITQQPFQQTHQFHLFQQEQPRRMQQHPQVHVGLDQQPGPVNAGSPTRIIGGGCAEGRRVPPFLGPVNFKLAVHEGNGGGSGDGLQNDEEDVVPGDDGSESRLHPWTTGEEESAIKEPFWRPLDVDYINRDNKRCAERQLEPRDSSVKHCKVSREGNNVEDVNNSANYKLFSELEAIYKPGSGGGGGASFGGGNRNSNQTASISALTAENPPTGAVELGPDGVPNTDTADQGSNASTAEEAAQVPKSNKSSGGSSGTSRKRKQKQQLSSIAAFLESLVKRVMEHQEGIHRKFLEVLERRDRERTEREETWRQQEAARASREAMERAQEQALASTREAAIISFLEKITGESLDLPNKAEFQSQLVEEFSQKEGTNHMDQPDAYTAAAGGGGNSDGNASVLANRGLNTSRWPKAEVQALIRVRSSLEWRFQEPGLKGPLWEEVSSAMAVLGYHRSAKRCKEKWENINKYFRKSKGSVKKRPQHSKTCPYFHELDQLYSRSLCTAPPTTSEREDATPAALHNPLAVYDEPTETLELPDVDSKRLVFHGREDHEENNTGATGGEATGHGQAAPQWPKLGNVEGDGDEEGEEEDKGAEEGEADEEGEGES